MIFVFTIPGSAALQKQSKANQITYNEKNRHTIGMLLFNWSVMKSIKKMKRFDMSFSFFEIKSLTKIA